MIRVTPIRLALVVALATVLFSASAFAGSFPSIERWMPWQTCASCALAGGSGPSVNHYMWAGVTSPSLDGDSTQFVINGGFPYADAIWWKQLGGDSNAAHFLYDLYFYIADTGASEALEFDVNQSTGGRKYTFGTQCGVNYDHQWDVWDTAGYHWRPTGVPCNVLPNTWNHYTGEFYRANGRTTVVSITLNGVKSYVNATYNSIPSRAYEVNVVFQMDQTAVHRAYSVWLDQVSLNTW